MQTSRFHAQNGNGDSGGAGITVADFLRADGDAPVNEPPAGGWGTPGPPWSLSETKSGIDNPGWGTVATQDQKMTAVVELDPYQYQGVDREWDYFLVFGTYRHAVRGNPDSAARNWVSVGYYASKMDLAIECLTPNAKLVDFGPSATIAQVTESYTIGASVTGGNSGGSAGLSTGFGVSFSTPEVTFRASGDDTSINWTVQLPHVGWQSPAIPANPATASYNGYLWRPSAIFRVPKGTGFSASVTANMRWTYDWTRGITHDEQSVALSQTFEYESLAERQPPSEAPVPLRRTIMETLRHDPSFATLVGALEFLGIVDDFDNGMTINTLVAPTDEAFMGGLWGRGGQSEDLLGPGTEQSLFEYIRGLITVGDLTKAKPGQAVHDVGGNLVDVTMHDGAIDYRGTELLTDRRIECSNGVILKATTMPPVRAGVAAGAGR